MSLSSRHGLAHRLTTLAAAAVLGMLTLVGLHAPIASAQEPEEPCLLDASLNYFTASRTTIEAGQSATLSWQVEHRSNPGCLSRLELSLESNGTRSPVNKDSTRSVSPAFTTTYRLYLLDSGTNQQNPPDTYLGNPITITVLQPPPTPPSDCS
jgi:hypothetical protein